jgi:hypothetical protein
VPTANDITQYEEITYKGDEPITLTAEEFRTLIGYFNTFVSKLNKQEKKRAHATALGEEE